MGKIKIYNFGNSNGVPCLYFHGFPSSGLEAGLCDDLANKRGWKIFSFDRPGYGNTEANSNSKNRSFYADVQSQLPSGKHIVIGVSGGAPYAMDYVAKHGDRVEALYLICPLAGLKSAIILQSYSEKIRFMLRLFQGMPEGLQVQIFKMVTFLRGQPEQYLPKFVRSLPSVDQSIFAGREDVFHSIFRTSRQQKMLGCVKDLHFYLGLDPGELQMPQVPIQIYHGLADTIVPPASSLLLGKLWPWAKVDMIPGEGHFSLPVARLAKLLD
jgi:pimeloyl-ACP methyl ester carboxylesterase